MMRHLTRLSFCRSRLKAPFLCLISTCAAGYHGWCTPGRHARVPGAREGCRRNGTPDKDKALATNRATPVFWSGNKGSRFQPVRIQAWRRMHSSKPGKRMLSSSERSEFMWVVPTFRV